MKKILFGFSLLSLLVLFGCQKSNPESCPINGTWYSCSAETGEVSLNDVENQILEILKKKDMIKLAEFVWEDWVRFSPYSYVNTGMDVVIKKDELIWLRNSDKKIERWSYDWSGEPILLTMKEYREKFIYDHDFAKALDRFVDKKIQRGNTISNAWEIYDWATWIEYYFSGFESQYEWIDWSSLTMIFEEKNWEWKLIGIVHGQRTI